MPTRDPQTGRQTRQRREQVLVHGVSARARNTVAESTAPGSGRTRARAIPEPLAVRVVSFARRCPGSWKDPPPWRPPPSPASPALTVGQAAALTLVRDGCIQRTIQARTDATPTTCTARPHCTTSPPRTAPPRAAPLAGRTSCPARPFGRPSAPPVLCVRSGASSTVRRGMGARDNPLDRSCVVACGDIQRGTPGPWMMGNYSVTVSEEGRCRGGRDDRTGN